MKVGWSEAALGEVATIIRHAVKPSDIVDGTLYVGLENIERGGAFRDVGRVSSGELASAKFAFDASNILYGKLRPNLGKIARPSFAECAAPIFSQSHRDQRSTGTTLHTSLSDPRACSSPRIALGVRTYHVSAPESLSAFTWPFRHSPSSVGSPDYSMPCRLYVS